jgi:hypothetical protein
MLGPLEVRAGSGELLEVGGARLRTRGLLTRLAARSRRRRMPPEYVFTARSAAFSSRNAASKSRARPRDAVRDWPVSR